MGKLLEYQCKKILEESGIPVPKNYLIRKLEDVEAAARELGFPIVLKAQLPITGRLKAGAIKFAYNLSEALEAVRYLFSLKIKGFEVKKILAEKKLDIFKEYYLGIIIDDSFKVRSPVIIFSTEGGVEIEEVATRHPEKIVKIIIDYIKGPSGELIKEELEALGISGQLSSKLSELAVKFYKEVFMKYEARAAEINPLILTRSGDLVAADCRITIDDNATFRHKEIKFEVLGELNRPLTPLEERIWKWEEKDPRGTGYFVQLVPEIKEPGYIGFHGIGGGGAMLAADALIRRGLKIANYADTSGDPPASKVYRVIKTILSQKGIEGYILMGSVIASQEQWHHAHAIVKALNEMLHDKPGFPVIILIAGNKEAETHEIIRRGLKDLPIRWELYGRDHIYEIDMIAERMKKMVDEYRREFKGGAD